MKRWTWVALLLVAVLSVVVTACGGSGTTTTAAEQATTTSALVTTTSSVAAETTTTGATATAADEARKANLAALYEKAKAEGQVDFLGSGDPTFYTKTMASFEQLYPGVKVNIGLNSPTVAAQLISEAQAGTVSVDILAGEAGDIPALVDRDLLVIYDWAQLADVDPSTFLFDGRFAVLGDNVGVFCYNTDKVAAADLPKTLDGLADPKWQGKVGISASGRFAAGWFAQWNQGDQDGAKAAIAKLVANKPLVATSGVQTLDSLVNGEVYFGWIPGATFLNALAKGAHIAIAPFTPWFGLNQGSYVMKNSKHPNAALLLNAFLMDKGTRPVLLQDPFFRFATEGDMAKALAAAGVTYQSAMTTADITSLLALWKAGAAAVSAK